MKRLFLGIFLSLMIATQVEALIVLTNKAIDLNKKSGTLKANVVLGNKIQKALAIGNYKVSSNNKSVIFNVNTIIKDNQTHNLSSQPSLIKPIKNKIIKRGSKLILAGENQEEIAKIFGLSLQEYQKKSGTNATSKNTPNSSSSNVTPSPSTSSSNGNSASSSASNFTSSNGSDYGSGYIPNNNNSKNDGTNYYPIPNNNGNSNNSENIVPEYSTQFCKAPYYDSKNSISLSFIAKDGSCMDIKAQRDDTKCEYRYDFNNGVAIKQTQFYYVDNENQIKNVGGCVDLQGDEYSYPLYKDDSKCQLQVTSNKGYNGNQAYFFQTQILFRGADNLVHMAKDCTDYQNVQEELISYDKDTKKKEVKRIVNQYYIDPSTGNKVYINNGIISPFKFPYQEYACGIWEMDDANLQAYRKTQIKAFDNVANTYIDVTSCDYSNDEDKTGRITQPYIKLPNNEKPGEAEPGDMNGSYEFEFKQALYGTGTGSVWRNCKGLFCSGSHSDDYTYYYLNGFQITKWTTTYKTTNTGVTTGYQRPKQPDEKEASIYYVSKRVKTIERTSRVIQNDLNLTADYMKFYEVNEGFYKDESIKTSPAFSDFISKYYKPKAGGLCQKYKISGGRVGDSKNFVGGYRNNVVLTCLFYNDYLLPTK
ncbi:hypothetical protein BKH42_08165 [Helicobacter sp. 13S00482-2]|uniref:hypothetical protein n=1 Tax=Helicobacter sp. 13S00482-2 TaxID=1476200 RepID=UPI000BA7A33C|nr:hypothetical protein [Helicobacter sp. 13S00482-2]PAF53019.1 hypothetical protein BKH42_08165 [Helicobacter sp. 13S00482-2]